MPRNNRYIIQKLVVKVNAEGVSRSVAQAYQDRVSHWVQDKLLLQLESWLDQQIPAEQSWQLDRLSLRCESTDLDNLSVLSEKVRENLTEQIAEVRSDASFQEIDESGRFLAVLEYYLRIGLLPWWSTRTTPELLVELKERILKEPEGIIQWLKGISANKAIIRRWSYWLNSQWLDSLPSKGPVKVLRKQWVVFQEMEQSLAKNQQASSSETYFWSLVLDTWQRENSTKGFIKKWVEQLPDQIQFLYTPTSPEGREPLRLHLRQRQLKQVERWSDSQWKRVWQTWTSEQWISKYGGKKVARKARQGVSVKEQRAIIRNALETAGLELLIRWNEEMMESADGSIAEPLDSLQKEELPDGSFLEEEVPEFEISRRMEEGLAVPYAGLVILHPFLPQFFDKLDYWDKDRTSFSSQEVHGRAVNALHWLASEHRNYGEDELILPKLLAGYPLGEAVPLWEPTPAEYEECQQLLQVIINAWSKLGKTSPAGLQETFLQRSGLLRQKANGYHLFVEHKTVDILLDALPWGFQTCKLPWMDQLLFIEWEY